MHWRLQLLARYYEFKSNDAILNHLNKHQIYMNPTDIKSVEARVAGFFVFLHIKYHSCKDATPETKERSMVNNFDLHIYIRDNGSITNKHIASMIWEQNLFLRDEISISVTVLKNIGSIITTPGMETKITVHRWTLSLKTADKSRHQLNAIERDPNDVYYFCTK
eukprot:4271309-Ditylum_brightwellii.AAC.2